MKKSAKRTATYLSTVIALAFLLISNSHEGNLYSNSSSASNSMLEASIHFSKGKPLNTDFPFEH